MSAWLLQTRKMKIRSRVRKLNRKREKKKISQRLAHTEVVIFNCNACHKTFKSSEMLEQHLQSKKHIKEAKGRSDEETTRRIVKKEPEHAPAHSLGVDAEIAKKIDKGRRLGFLECSFCGEVSEDAESTAEHMAKAHSFFVPDIEYLVSLEGLLAYIGDKVGVGHCCLYCHKPFDSLKACRRHMEDMSHWKMTYDDDADEEAGEFDDYYDFSSTYDEETLKSLPKVQLSADGTQLILGDSGKAVGHRALQVYYNQAPRPNRDIVVANTRNSLMRRYKQIGWTNQKSSIESVQARKARQKQHRDLQRQNLKVGMATERGNEKYFRRRDLVW